MLEKIKQKIRALINDLVKSDFESFIYETSNIFTLTQTNIQEITKVTVDDTELGSGEWSFDSTTNEVEITMPSGGSIVVIKYTYYKYSDDELTEYIRAALVWLDIFTYTEESFELDSTEEIVPEPNIKTIDLIALISSILINPDWNEYRLPTLTVRYGNKISKEDRIEKLINRFKSGLGVNGVLEWNTLE